MDSRKTKGWWYFWRLILEENHSIQERTPIILIAKISGFVVQMNLILLYSNSPPIFIWKTSRVLLYLETDLYSQCANIIIPVVFENFRSSQCLMIPPIIRQFFRTPLPKINKYCYSNFSIYIC